MSIILAPQHRKQERNLFLQRPQFFFPLATFTIVLIVFIYIFALLSHCNYLHLEKQLYSVLIIKHLGETAAEATLHRFVPPAISFVYIQILQLCFGTQWLIYTLALCLCIFFFVLFFFHSTCSSSAQSCNLLSTDRERYAAFMQRCSGRDPVH